MLHYWRKNGVLLLLALLFFAGLILISFSMERGMYLVFLCLLVIYSRSPKHRFVALIFFTFLGNFFLFQLTNQLLADRFDLSEEQRILCNRSLLILIIAGLYILHLFYKQKVSFFQQKPEWNHRIVLPFHSTSVFHFLLLGLIINVVIFASLIIQQEFSYLQSVVVFGLLFSIINSVFEEAIWRGIVLSSLQKRTSLFYAVTVTSIGFGLMHLSIGFSFSASLLFSFAGLAYAFIVWNTKSIYPAILFHFIINMGMVLSGWVL